MLHRVRKMHRHSWILETELRMVLYTAYGNLSQLSYMLH